MRWTIDTYTGERFAWNTTTLARTDDGDRMHVPARITDDGLTWLHPNRVPIALMMELNP